MYVQEIQGCFEQQVNDGGIAPLQLDRRLHQLSEPFQNIRAHGQPASAALLREALREDDLPAIEALGKELRERFKHIVIAGSGGSGLSGHTLTALRPSSVPHMHYLENIDPDVLEEALRLNPEECCYISISKSGSTAETLSQFYVLWEHARAKLGEKAAEHFIIITMQTPSPLRTAAQDFGIRCLEHPADVGGRFSALTVVGLLPAACAGLDIRSWRAGAREVVQRMQQAGQPQNCPPALGAALQCAFIDKGYLLNIMLPYAQRLAAFSSWYRQGWAESLGKNGKGSTPIRAVGTTDQHSQLQLYLDGPKDKLFHLILLERAGKGPRINAPALPELEYLRGKTIGDVMAAEQQATYETLLRNNCPVRLITLRELNEKSLGALMMHFMLEIIFTASLLEVNAFDQPAVEEGKELARQWLLSGHASA